MFGGDDELAFEQCVSSQGDESANPIDPTDAAVHIQMQSVPCYIMARNTM